VSVNIFVLYKMHVFFIIVLNKVFYTKDVYIYSPQHKKIAEFIKFVQKFMNP